MSLTVAELQYRTKVWYTLGTVRMLWGPYGQENACILHIRSIYAAHTHMWLLYIHIPDARHVYLTVALGGICGWFMGWEEKKFMRKIGQLVNIVRLKMLDYFPQAVHRSVIHC